MQPTPTQSFLGGVGLTFPVHALLLFNGSSFGVSGFIHRAVRGSFENGVAVIGLIVGGLAVGLVDGKGSGPQLITGGLQRIALSGLLVGAGTKLSGGCTSGHMLSGVSRLSLRSIVATATFFSTAIATSRFLYANTLSTIDPTDWSLGPSFFGLAALQLAALAIEGIGWISFRPLPVDVRSSTSVQTPTLDALAPKGPISLPLSPDVIPMPVRAPNAPLRMLICFLTAFHFSIALRLSNLVFPERVTRFLLTPLDAAFDPSLAALALGVLPLSMLFYHVVRPKNEEAEVPRLGGAWCIPKGSVIDAKLIVGSVMFGLGWGLSGVCPGPGLINLGRALATGGNPTQEVLWLATVIAGGFFL